MPRFALMRLDKLRLSPRLGNCTQFHVTAYEVERDVATPRAAAARTVLGTATDPPQPRALKTLMHFEGCNPEVSAGHTPAVRVHNARPHRSAGLASRSWPCWPSQRFGTILLRGASHTELVALKQALQFLLYAGYAMFLEAALARDEFAMPAATPPPGTARPDRQLPALVAASEKDPTAAHEQVRGRAWATRTASPSSLCPASPCPLLGTMQPAWTDDLVDRLPPAYRRRLQQYQRALLSTSPSVVHPLPVLVQRQLVRMAAHALSTTPTPPAAASHGGGDVATADGPADRDPLHAELTTARAPPGPAAAAAAGPASLQEKPAEAAEAEPPASATSGVALIPAASHPLAGAAGAQTGSSTDTAAVATAAPADTSAGAPERSPPLPAVTLSAPAAGGTALGAGPADERPASSSHRHAASRLRATNDMPAPAAGPAALMAAMAGRIGDEHDDSSGILSWGDESMDLTESDTDHTPEDTTSTVSGSLRASISDGRSSSVSKPARHVRSLSGAKRTASESAGASAAAPPVAGDVAAHRPLRPVSLWTVDITPPAYQRLSILFAVFCPGLSTPCKFPHSLSIQFYSESDMTLGQYIEELVRSARTPCGSCSRYDVAPMLGICGRHLPLRFG